MLIARSGCAERRERITPSVLDVLDVLDMLLLGVISAFHRGLSFLAIVTLCLGAPGCAAQHDDALRLSEELGRSRVEAAWQQARAAELEVRLSRLEQRVSAPPVGPSAAERELLGRLDQLIAVNERLLAEHAAPAGPTAPEASAPAVASSAPASLTPTVEPASEHEQQLRALVQRFRGHPGRLTREQENALHVLTRPERQLDADNPWPAAFY